MTSDGNGESIVGDEMLSDGQKSRLEKFDDVLWKLDDIATWLAGEESGGAEESGLQRLLGAVNRLRSMVRFTAKEGENISFDPLTVATLTTTVANLINQNAWSSTYTLEIASEIETHIKDQIRRYLDELEKQESRLLHTPFGLSLRQVEREATMAIDGIRLERHFLSQRERLDAIVDDAQQAAGTVADSELATAFNTYEKAEAKTANYFRRGALGVLLGVLALSVYSSIKLPTNLGSSLAHLGIALSGLAAFAYLARESSQHRNSARWAAIMAVQLKTIGAFSSDMSTEQREELRAYFGRRVFSELPAVQGSEKDPRLTPDSVQAVIEILKSLRGNP